MLIHQHWIPRFSLVINIFVSLHKECMGFTLNWFSNFSNLSLFVSYLIIKVTITSESIRNHLTAVYFRWSFFSVLMTQQIKGFISEPRHHKMIIFFQNLLTLRSFSHLAGEVECHHSQVVYISSSEVRIEHSVDKWIEAAISKYQFYDYIFNQCRSWTLIMLLPVYHSLRGKMYKNRKVL